MSVALQDQFRATSGSYVLEFRPGAAEHQRGRLALRDIADGLKLWRLVLTLGWLDIRLRYRGSLLGPFWLTISTAIMVGALGFLYATLFHVNVHEYLPFIALSQVLWGFIGGVIADGCGCFTQAEGTIRAVRMPFFIHALRGIVRNLLILAHNAVVIVVVYVAFAINPGWGAVQSLGGVVLWLIAASAVCLPLGAVCARFRDIPQIVGSVMQIGFFLTPIIWLPKQLGPYEHLLLLNPFFDMLEVVRAPLLGYAAGVHVWEAAVLITFMLAAISFAIFARARGRIAFWV